MYAKRVQLINYGPVEHVDITFPFVEDSPKPVVLVGKNGTGKSILLSHIINGLIASQGVAYPETPEVEAGKVYKLRSSAYIHATEEYYFARVDYVDGLSVGELRTRNPKTQESPPPKYITESDAQDAWQKMPTGENDYYFGPIQDPNDERKIKDTLRSNCVLYFPSNRFEEPAWLNESNLLAKAEYMNLFHLEGYTNRHIINYSPMRQIQHWLFEVIFDRGAFDIRTAPVNLPVQQGAAHATVPVQLFLGYSGQSTDTYQVALDIIRQVISQTADVRLGIGPRQSRIVSIMAGDLTIVPNIFQLSSGETSLLNLFLSILRDADLSGSPLTGLESIKGIVVVDEIELNLHVNHQHGLLPELIKQFPNVQFIITTQSPFFVLGMHRTFGADGFGLYRMPEGGLIDPEEFSEFGQAYEVFAETSKFADDVRSAIKASQMPIVFVDGETDVKYLQCAAELLGKSPLLENIDLRPANGDGNLKNIWKGAHGLPADLVPQKVVLLHDCDSDVTDATAGNLIKRKVPQQSGNPIQKGVENLFGWSTLQKAKADKSAFIDVTPETTIERRGQEIVVPLCWEVNESEKMNLCNWLCENGNADDFANFNIILDKLEELLETLPASPKDS